MFPILFGIISSFLLLGVPYIDWSNVQRQKTIVVIWGLYLLTLIVSTLFSVNIPLSLANVSLNILAFIFFLFWLGFLNHKNQTHFLTQGLLVIGAVLVLLSIGMLFFPQFQLLLPGMNLLYATHGHNHIAAYLLLILPLSWYYWSQTRNLSSFVLYLFFLFGLFVSLGRVATVIGFLQLLVLWWRFRKMFRGWHSLLLIVLFGSVIAIKVFFSVQTQCELPRYLNKLCKPVAQELRSYYWGQAVEALRNRPLFGSGPGTFHLDSSFYRQVPYASTNYAHNAFLQQFAEVGVSGGILFMLLIGLLVIKGREHFFAKEFALASAAYIAVLASAVNAFFDFDWSFIGIFLVTLLLAAIYLVDAKAEGSIKKVWAEFAKVLYVICNLFLIGSALLYVVLQLMLGSTYERLIPSIFPYFHTINEALAKPNQSPEVISVLDSVNRNLPSWYFYKLSQASGEAEKTLIAEKIVELDPWQILYQDTVQHYLEQQHWEKADTNLRTVISFLNEKRDVYGFYKESIDHQRKEKIAQQALTLSKYFITQGDGAKAAEYWLDAHYFEAWSAASEESFPFNPKSDMPETAMVEFLIKISAIDIEYFGDTREEFGSYYAHFATSLYEQGNYQDAQQFAQRALEMREWLSGVVWYNTAPVLLTQAQTALQNGDSEQAKQFADGLFSLHQVVMNYQYEDLKYLSDLQGLFSQELAGIYLELYNTALGSEDLSTITDSLTKALSLHPQLLEEKTLWLENTDLSQEPTPRLFTVADAHLEALYELNRIQKEQVYQQLYQEAANRALEVQDYQRAEQYVAAMSQLLPKDYWAIVQRGHLYTVMGKHEQARQVFEQCITSVEYYHDDCEAALTRNKQGEYDVERYWQVSEIILGKKSYTDF